MTSRQLLHSVRLAADYEEEARTPSFQLGLYLSAEDLVAFIIALFTRRLHPAALLALDSVGLRGWPIATERIA